MMLLIKNEDPSRKIVAAFFCGLLIFLVGMPLSRASDPAPEEIIRRSLAHMVFRARGAEMTITMALHNSKNVRQRTLFSQSRTINGLSHTLVRFLAPSDVAGTAFLLVEKKDGEDEQHMYLPALKVVKRIVGRQKQAQFMGSEFTYADLEWHDLEQAQHVQQPDEKIGQHPCFVIDSLPRQQTSYTKIRSFIRRADYVPLRVQFFAPAASLLKVLFIKEVKKIGGTIWATQLKMVNKKTGKSTQLSLSQIRLRDDLPARLFTIRSLKQ